MESVFCLMVLDASYRKDGAPFLEGVYATEAAAIEAVPEVFRKQFERDTQEYTYGMYGDTWRIVKDYTYRQIREYQVQA